MFPILEAGPLARPSTPAGLRRRPRRALPAEAKPPRVEPDEGRPDRPPAGRQGVRRLRAAQGPADLMARAVGFFRAVYRLQRTEALVLLVWRDGSSTSSCRPRRSHGVSVKPARRTATCRPGRGSSARCTAMARFGAYASSTDEDDEAELRRAPRRRRRLRPAAAGYAAAIVVDGIGFDLTTDVVFERPRRLVEPPDDWLQKVKLAPPPRGRRPRQAHGSNRARASALGRDPKPSGPSELDDAIDKASKLADRARLSPLATGSSPVSGSSRKGGAPMAERIVLVGCGGIGSQLLPPLVRYLATGPSRARSSSSSTGTPSSRRTDRGRPAPTSDLGTNKAEALARVAGAGWRSRRSPST